MPPLWNQRTPPAKIFGPIEIARVQLRGGFVAAVVEHDGRARTLAAIAIYRRHVRTVHAVVLELLVEGLHAHCADAFGNQIADRIIDHRGGDARIQAEAIRQIRGTVELTAAHVNLAFGRFAERDDARIQPVDQRTDRNKVQCAFLTNIKTVFHSSSPVSLVKQCRCWPKHAPPLPVQFVWKYSPRGLSIRS